MYIVADSFIGGGNRSAGENIHVAEIFLKVALHTITLNLGTGARGTDLPPPFF
jgi:hypothetical protein